MVSQEPDPRAPPLEGRLLHSSPCQAEMQQEENSFAMESRSSTDCLCNTLVSGLTGVSALGLLLQERLWQDNERRSAAVPSDFGRRINIWVTGTNGTQLFLGS
jgi:hypothetical protein